MFCSGWLARANAGNSNPSMQRNDAALFSRVNEAKRTQRTYRLAAMLEAWVNVQPAVKRVDFGKQNSYRSSIPDLNLPNAAESDRVAAGSSSSVPWLPTAGALEQATRRESS